MMKYYEEGYKAFKQGKDLSECPYDGEEKLHWEDGWMDASEDFEGKTDD